MMAEGGTMATAGIELAERRWLPDRVVRAAMRRLIGRRLEKQRREAEDLRSFVQRCDAAPVAPVPEKANEQHYEVPAAFFEAVLGPRHKYSCCYWDAGSDLARAEQDSLEAVLDRAEIEDGMEILELGCGWGALTLFLAERFPNSRITAVSNSTPQRRFIEQRATETGVAGRLQVLTRDMNDFAAPGTYDRVVSLEMFEHMRNHRELMRRISTWLNQGGKLFVHVFCHEDLSYEFVDEGPSDWMSRYFFSGGIMPAKDLLRQYQDDLALEATWEWSGTHYEKTCNAWLDRMDANRQRVLPILREAYGVNEASRWFQRWRMFFMAGAELFGYRQGTEWKVAHYRFAKEGG